MNRHQIIEIANDAKLKLKADRVDAGNRQGGVFFEFSYPNRRKVLWIPDKICSTYPLDQLTQYLVDEIKKKYAE